MSGALHDDLNGEVSLNFEFQFFSLSLFIFIGWDQCCNCRTLMRWDDLLTSFSFYTISKQPNSQCCDRNSLFSGVLLRASKKSFVQSDYSTGISHSSRILSALSIFALSTIRKNIYNFHSVFTCLYCYRVESGKRTRSLMRDMNRRFEERILNFEDSRLFPESNTRWCFQALVNISHITIECSLWSLNAMNERLNATQNIFNKRLYYT